MKSKIACILNDENKSFSEYLDLLEFNIREFNLNDPKFDAEEITSQEFEGIVYFGDTDDTLLSTIESIRNYDFDIPFIICSYNIDEDMLLRFLRCNITDVLDINKMTAEDVSKNIHRGIPRKIQNDDLESTINLLHNLYNITTDKKLTFKEKQEKLLQKGCEYLNIDSAFISEIKDGKMIVDRCYGDDDVLEIGLECPIDQAYCKKTVDSNRNVVSMNNPRKIDWNTNPSAYETFEFDTYIGSKIMVNGDLHGTLCFVSQTGRQKPVTQTEETIVEVMASWVSYELENQINMDKLEDRNEDLRNFAGFVSHDLRNPLSIAKGHTSILKNNIELTDRNRESIEAIENAHNRIDDIINDVLLISGKKQSLDKEEFDLTELIESCWKNVPLDGITLDLKFDEMIVEGDKSKIAQVIENLFRNVQEHGGDNIEVGQIKGGFYIQDNGDGIPEEARNNLFEMGFSTNEDGNGIGLKIVSQIIELHDWKIRAVNSDKGAKFEVLMN